MGWFTSSAGREKRPSRNNLKPRRKDTKRWVMEFPGEESYHISSSMDILIGELYKKYHPECENMSPFSIMKRQHRDDAYAFYRKMSREGKVKITPFD